MTYKWWYGEKFHPVEKVYGTKWMRCAFCDSWMKNYYIVKSCYGGTYKASKGCLTRIGLCDADFDDPKRIDNPHGSKPWKPKPELIPFEKIVGDHKFKVLSVGTLPEGTHYWCAFCGGRLRHPIEIMRDDRKKFIVGSNCLSRVGLKPEVIPDLVVPNDAEKKDNEPVEKSEKKAVSDSDMEEDEWLNNLVKEKDEENDSNNVEKDKKSDSGNKIDPEIQEMLKNL